MKNNKCNKILVIRAGAIGDVVHTTAVYRAIKKAYPKIKIHYMSSPLLKDFFKEDPDIDKFIPINPNFKLFSDYTKQMAKILKKENYKLVINLQPSIKIRTLIFLSGIKKQLIYRKSFKKHAVINFWETALKEFPKIKEPKELKLYLPKENIEKAKEKLANLKHPLIIFNAGGVLSKRQGRTYPIEQWIELGNKLQEKYNGTIILNGSSEDIEILSPLNNIQNSINFIGKLPLVDSCSIISQADLMISGDSGPLHIATALNIKSIGLYGSMPTKRTGCFCSGLNIVSTKKCAPCNKRKCKFIKSRSRLYAPCMEEIPVNSIIQSVNLS